MRNSDRLRLTWVGRPPDADLLQERYGSFYADFKEEGWAAYFYVVSHAFENVFCAIIEASMQDDTYGMYIVTGVLILVYMIIICAVRPFAESEGFWFLQGLNIVVIYSMVVAYVSDTLSEKADGLSESEELGLYISSIVTLVFMVVFTTYSTIPLFELAKETLWDPLREKLRSRDDGLRELADSKISPDWLVAEYVCTYGKANDDSYVWL
jgi:hypothetical protein